MSHFLSVCFLRIFLSPPLSLSLLLMLSSHYAIYSYISVFDHLYIYIPTERHCKMFKKYFLFRKHIYNSSFDIHINSVTKNPVKQVENMLVITVCYDGLVCRLLLVWEKNLEARYVMRLRVKLDKNSTESYELLLITFGLRCELSI